MKMSFLKWRDLIGRETFSKLRFVGCDSGQYERFVPHFFEAYLHLTSLSKQEVQIFSTMNEINQKIKTVRTARPQVSQFRLPSFFGLDIFVKNCVLSSSHKTGFGKLEKHHQQKTNRF
jgi:hypothetical protein